MSLPLPIKCCTYTRAEHPTYTDVSNTDSFRVEGAGGLPAAAAWTFTFYMSHVSSMTHRKSCCNMMVTMCAAVTGHICIIANVLGITAICSQ